MEIGNEQKVFCEQCCVNADEATFTTKFLRYGRENAYGYLTSNSSAMIFVKQTCFCTTKTATEKFQIQQSIINHDRSMLNHIGFFTSRIQTQECSLENVSFFLVVRGVLVVVVGGGGSQNRISGSRILSTNKKSHYIDI